MRLEVEVGRYAGWLAPLPWSDEGRLAVRVSDRSLASEGGTSCCCIRRAWSWASGWSAAHPAGLLLGHVAWTLEAEGLARASLCAAVATLDLKGDEPAVAALESAAAPVRCGETLGRIEVPNPSPAVAAAVGTASVAEAAALAAAGEGAVLAVSKADRARGSPAPWRGPRRRKAGLR